MALRLHGRIAFADIEDESGRIQVLLDRDRLGIDYDLIPMMDVGDFVAVTGTLTRTARGELSVSASAVSVLTKSLRPLPDKRKGLQDPELRYRRRSEFLATDAEARSTFRRRSAIVTAVRTFLDGRGFLEVEVPVLQPVYGGASAKPFETWVNALDQQHYLSISPELYLKRLVVGGFERVYSVGKNFRNESIDRTHNPEFTMMECYQAYADYNDMMRLTEDLYDFVCRTVAGTTRFEYGQADSPLGKAMLDFAPPWQRVKMLDVVRDTTRLPVEEMSDVDIRKSLTSDRRFAQVLSAHPVELLSWGELVQCLFEEFAEHTLIQPTFVIDHPRETTPLCKTHRDDPRLIERFEPFAYGMEIGNAYSELNDPVLQRLLLESQRSDAQPESTPTKLDEEFCRAIEVGLPPTGGLGLGIDRMAMLLTGSTSIKDVILFPLMRV